MRKIIIGVIGPAADATDKDIDNAIRIGQLIATEGWVLLTGGRNAGVMDAASKGAKQANGLTIGILPTAEPASISPAVDIPIITDMHNARNNINVLTSNVLIACGMGAGTASEIALAIKAKKLVIMLGVDREGNAFFKKLGGDNVIIAENTSDAIKIARKMVKSRK